MIVFYEFSNGELNSNCFNKDAKILDIMKWGEDRAKWFDDRLVELASLEEQVHTLIDNQE